MTYSKEIADSSESNAASIFGALRALAVTLTSYAFTGNGLYTNLTWPYVALPNFDKRSFQTQEISGAEVCVFSPFVFAREKKGWENYSWEHQNWIEIDLKYQSASFGNPGNISREIYAIPEFANQSSERAAPYYTPVWQTGPLPHNASVVNLDLHTHPILRPIIDNILVSKNTMMSGVVDLNFLYQLIFAGQVADGRPLSFILKPIFKDLTNNSAVVGILSAVVKWDSFFQNVLPEGTNGVLVTVQDTCGSLFTYVINGRTAAYYGGGDLHNSKYDSMKQSFQFVTNGTDTIDFGQNSSLLCEYTLTVYPTVAFEAHYRSNKAILYAVVVVLVFLYTSVVFLIYDWTVWRRQRTVLSSVERTTQIVSSMFPKNVKDRLLSDAHEQAEKESREVNRRGIRNRRKQLGIQDVLNAQNDNSKIDKEEKNTGHGFTLYKTKPIADLFPETTIMFADLVGFTAWSSTRDPVQVFTLLETIYHAFDQIAKRRRVFKVETVGDCYVAVAGLPGMYGR